MYCIVTMGSKNSFLLLFFRTESDNTNYYKYSMLITYTAINT